MTTIRMIGRNVLFAFVAFQIAAAVSFAAAAVARGGGPIDVPAVVGTHQHGSII